GRSRCRATSTRREGLDMLTLLRSRTVRWLVVTVAVSFAGTEPAALAGGHSARAIREIMETFARPSVDDGQAGGVVVGVTYRGRPPQFFTYGLAEFEPSQKVKPGTIFEIGSVTKVFTTAILGQNVVNGVDTLDEMLSQFPVLLGPLKTQTGAV